MSKLDTSKPIVIRKVWQHNLVSEFSLIRSALHRYRFVSMDTEFPGVIHSPEVVDRRRHRPSDNYRYLKANVDTLKLIQLGLTLTDQNGNLPHFGTNFSYIWEFNFRDFDVHNDLQNKDSIELLSRQGIDFIQNRLYGVDSITFSGLMFWSRLVCNESVTWVTFHGASDFGYLVKILTRRNLPDSLEAFMSTLSALFGGYVYDMKHIMLYCNGLYGGLDQIATTLSVDRVAGKSHQAASDSLLTFQTFQKMALTYFSNDEIQKHAGVIFSLG